MNPHRFKCSLDGLSVGSPNMNYITIIYCEYCGLVAYDANSGKTTAETQKKLSAVGSSIGDGCPFTPPKDIK